MESLLNSETDYLNLYIIPWGVNLIMALVIFIVGRWLAKTIRSIVKRLMNKAEMDEILTNFVGNMLHKKAIAIVYCIIQKTSGPLDSILNFIFSNIFWKKIENL